MSMPSTVTGMAASSSTGSASSAMSMSGMDMGSGSDACKILALWNWNIIDSCFISSFWHVTSKGDFAGSCIGVFFLVVVLEVLRRLQREYDAYLVKQHQARAGHFKSPIHQSPTHSPLRSDVETNNRKEDDGNGLVIPSTPHAPGIQIPSQRQEVVFSFAQRSIRALIHMLQFAITYFVMLLAMNYNGYITITIFIGAFSGAFISSWKEKHIINA